MAAKPSFYITTAISYPNGEPHIGHAYEAIATDAIARFKRLDGYDVYFLTGVDEHGLKMKQTATKAGITPSELAERNTPRFKAMVEALNISNDDFIRTTEKRHHAASAEMWKRMAAAGDIYVDNYAGWYSVRDEAFYAEDETTVREDGVRVGGQNTPVEWTEESTYFFRLSAYQEKLLAHYEANPDFILPPERRNEVVSFVKGGLQDLSISRTTFDWGIPVPDAPGHIMYVWVDALTNYITGVGFPDVDSASFKKYWPADIHMIGKDITRFHAVYWPAFLMSAGIALPKRVYSHGFLFNKGIKMSKSDGNVVDPFSMSAQYGVDAMRYFFLREVPFGSDGSYSHEAIVNRTNADLANNIGNLASRSLSIASKNCNGAIPEPGPFTDAEKTLLASADALIGIAREAMERQALHRVLEAVAAVSSDTNGYFADAAPWALKKTDPARMSTVLYVTAEVLRQVGILLQPFIPVTADKLLSQLGIAEDDRGFDSLGEAGRLKPGTPLGALGPVFPRYVEPEGKAAE
jgi:methionyl-tRNA synthetase